MRWDPWLIGACSILLLAVGWSCAPFATAAFVPVTSSQRIEVTVPVSTSVTPGWRSGDTSVRLPDLGAPGQTRDATSAGWRLSTNWANGYEVRVRSTTAPALRGQNAVDGEGASESFQDYTQANCPCPWTTGSFDRGVFGYSVSVASTSGAQPVGAAKWGSSSNRSYRGFSRSSYQAFATPGGAGEYTMSVHFRTEIPQGTVQREGSYRGTMVVSVHPLL